MTSTIIMTSKISQNIDVDHQKRLEELHHRLLFYYGEPVWRLALSPVDELVSTFLSQNTNDLNRDKAFDAIKRTYSSWEEVRDADPSEFIHVIQVAGLANQKGPNIQNALRIITETCGGIHLDWLKGLPVEEARSWLKGIKGVGPKTAAIVLLFSLGMPAFPVDTHIYRVTGRMGLRPLEFDVEKTHLYLEEAVNPDYYENFHLNLIRLGREICQARKPNCRKCPVLDLCNFSGKQI